MYQMEVIWKPIFLRFRRCVCVKQFGIEQFSLAIFDAMEDSMNHPYMTVPPNIALASLSALLKSFQVQGASQPSDTPDRIRPRSALIGRLLLILSRVLEQNCSRRGSSCDFGVRYSHGSRPSAVVPKRTVL